MYSSQTLQGYRQAAIDSIPNEFRPIKSITKRSSLQT